MNPLLDALGYAGSALSAPGDYTRGLLAGRPGERVNPRQLLDAWGADLDEEDDSWLGWGRDLAVGVATDPLTYALPFAGNYLGAKLASKLPTGVSGTARAGATMEELAGSPALKALGENITRFENVVPGSTDDAAKFLAHAGRRGADADFLDEALGAVEGAAAAEAKGSYWPHLDTMGTSPGATVGTKRHEFMHGLIDQAAKGDQVGALPLTARPAGALRKALYDEAAATGRSVGSIKGEVPAWATFADELAGHLHAGTTPMEKLAGAAGFLFHPGKQAAYAPRIAERGLAGTTPWAARVYRAFGGAPRAAGSLAGLAPGVASAGLRGQLEY